MRLGHGLALLLLIGCGDDDKSNDDAPDAMSPMDAAAADATMDARADRDTSVPDSELPASGPLDAAQLPAMPASLSVGLTKTACEGTCPTYQLDLNQAGLVTFVGFGCSARPGVFTKTVAPSAVQSFYDQLRASPYFSLRNSYATPAECPTYALDHAGQLWNVVVDGTRKPLTYDQGCMGVPELAQIDALVPQLVAAADVQAWIGNGEACEVFRGEAPIGELANRYRLARDGKAIGMVEFLPDLSFQVESCDGTVLGTGTTRAGSFSSLLIDESARKLKLGELEFGSIVLIRPSENEDIQAYGLRESDELRLGIIEAASCTTL
jgi:hypothetical protein